MGLAPSLATHSAASLARCPPRPGSQVFGDGSGVCCWGQVLTVPSRWLSKPQTVWVSDSEACRAMVLAFMGLATPQITPDLWDLGFHVLRSCGPCGFKVERAQVRARL